MAELPQHELSFAFSALRQLAQAYDRVVVVEDQQTGELLGLLPGSGRSFFASNLNQLGCGHLSRRDALHDAAKVIEIVSYASRGAERERAGGAGCRLAGRLRGLVDRDICPSYSPTRAVDGIVPPTRHAQALSEIELLRCTPLNDIESTFFVECLSVLLERLGVLDAARKELLLPDSETPESVARSLVVDWLVPLFCVRSFFARQSPAWSSKGVPVVIASRSLPRLCGGGAALAGSRIADALPFVAHRLDASQRRQLAAETSAAVSASSLHPHLIHGHDLLQVICVLRDLRDGLPAMSAEQFESGASAGWSPGMRQVREKERSIAEEAAGVVKALLGAGMPSAILAAFADSLLSNGEVDPAA